MAIIILLDGLPDIRVQTTKAGTETSGQSERITGVSLVFIGWKMG